MKKDESAEHIVRSSILRLLREDESGSPNSAPQRLVKTSDESAVNDILALRSKTRGTPVRFKA